MRLDQLPAKAGLAQDDANSALRDAQVDGDLFLRHALSAQRLGLGDQALVDHWHDQILNGKRSRIAHAKAAHLRMSAVDVRRTVLPLCDLRHCVHRRQERQQHQHRDPKVR